MEIDVPGEPEEISEETKKKIESHKFFFQRTKYIFDFAIETW
jgi:hypothetical protein